MNDSKLGGGSTAGGGFSTHFSRPFYQEEALTGYLARVNNTSIAPHTGYNRLGRGYPDVAVVAVNYLVVMNDNTLIFGGTSASTHFSRPFYQQKARTFIIPRYYIPSERLVV